MLRVGNGAEPETLDPHQGQGVSAGNIVRDLYEGLTSQSPSGAVAGGAAERWEVSADGRVYTFHLRPGARWSSGEAVTADDFVAGLRRSADPAAGARYPEILAPIENAEDVSAGRLPPDRLGAVAPDAHTVVIRLAQPTPYFLQVLSHPASFPVYRPNLLRYGREFARPGRLVGNGAYTLVEWAVQSRIVLVRNRNYWDDAHTAIDRVEYYPTEDLASELKRYRAGELDLTSAIPMAQAAWVRRTLGAELHLAPYLGTYFYGFNLARAPFAGNANLRRALSMAVDRELIAGKLLQGAALPAYGLLPPGMPGYPPARPDWADWPASRRIAQARALYAQAGYSDQHPLQVELRFNTSEDNRRIALLVAAMWQQRLGVRTQLVNEEWKVFLQNRRLRSATQAFRVSWIGDYADPMAFARILRSSDGRNDEAYDSPAYDALLAAASAQADAPRRAALFAQAEQRLAADTPILPIFHYLSKHLVKPYVDGWSDNPLDVHYTKDLRLRPH